MFKKDIFPGNKSIIVRKEEIENWVDTFRKGKDTLLLLMILYPNQQINDGTYQQDHCHPTKMFTEKYLKKTRIKKWSSKKDLLPNLQILKDFHNNCKDKTPLDEWCKEYDIKVEYVTKSSLNIMHFDDFYDERRWNMIRELY